MGAWKDRGASIWDLWLVVYAIVALSAATDVCGFMRFAPAFGLPSWAGALCVVPIKLIEWRFLTFATRLLQSGLLGRIICSMPVMTWCLSASFSMIAAHSTIYDMFASPDRVTANEQ
jgi:hypothetical protein